MRCIFCCSQLLNKWCYLFVCLVASITHQLSCINTTFPLNKLNIALLLMFKNRTVEHFVCTNNFFCFRNPLLFLCCIAAYWFFMYYRTQSHILLNLHLLYTLLVIDTVLMGVHDHLVEFAPKLTLFILDEWQTTATTIRLIK